MTDWTPSERWPHYTRATAEDVLAAPATPLTVQFCWEGGLIPGWRDGYVESGSYRLEEFDPNVPEVVGFFGGRLYLNLSNVRMQGVRSPALTVDQLDAALFGGRTDVPPYEPHPDDEQPDLAPAVIAHLAWILSTQEYPEADEFADRARLARAERPDPTSMTARGLLERLRELQPLLRTGFHHHRVTASASGVAPGLLAAIGDAIGEPDLPVVLCAGIGNVDSVEPSLRLWELSRQVRNSETLTRAFDEDAVGVLDRLDRLDVGPTDDQEHIEIVEFLGEWHRFIEDFGSFGPNEWELCTTTWETDPTPVLAMLDSTRHRTETDAPLVRHRQRSTERATKLAEVRTAIAELRNDELAAQFEGAITAIGQLAFRERTKTALMRVMHECRMAFRELGRRATEAGDLLEPDHVFMLLDGELEMFVARVDARSDADLGGGPPPSAEELATRHAQWRELHDLEPPYMIVNGVVPPLDEWPRRSTPGADGRGAAISAAPSVAGDVLHGIACCPGIERGRAHVAGDATTQDAPVLEPGDILVVSSADASWSPVYANAAGVVMADGGQISHAVVIARELGVPCVASVADAAKRIPHGAVVEIDGAAGRVTVVEVP